MKKIILASQSPRRKQLLEWAEITFDIIIKNTDESYPGDLPVNEVATYIASKKLDEVHRSLPSDWNHNYSAILAADTIVVLDKQVIGKPANRSHAIHILQQLSGNTHEVITGISILEDGGTRHEFFNRTAVCFHDLPLDQIEFYVDAYKPYDKAGAYAIQEWIGVIGIQSINGDFYNVMGLPVSQVAKILSRER